MKLATIHFFRGPAAVIAAALAILALPSAAQASFTIDDFETRICATEFAPAGGAPCPPPGNNAPAGAHRASTVSFDFGGDEPVHDIIQHFPIGIIPNPQNVGLCTDATVDATPPSCPATSQLGTTNLVADIDFGVLGTHEVTLTGKVYNLEVHPPYVGGLAFITDAILPLPGVTIGASALKAPFSLRTGESTVSNPAAAPPYDFSQAPYNNSHFLTDTLPGGSLDDPGTGTFSAPPVTPHKQDDALVGVSAAIPNEVEGFPLHIKHIDYTLNGVNTTGVNAAGEPALGDPYITLSTGCLTGRAEVEATTWSNPAVKVGASAPNSHNDPNGSNFSSIGTTSGCDSTHPPFSPTLLTPTLGTSISDTPSSYDIKVGGLDDGPYPSGENLHESDLRKAEVTLPLGTALSPAAASGLAGCSDAQLGVGDNNPPSCPAASDVGDVIVKTNNLPADAQPAGNVYLGEPTPQDTYRLFLAFEIVDGLWVKQVGVSKPDPDTGQITTTFDQLPSLPFTETTLRLKKPDGTPVLVNPPDCGSHTITSVLTSFKFPTPSPPFSSPTGKTTPSTSFNIDGCSNPKPFDPFGSLTTDPTQAAGDTNLTLALTAADREQLLKTLRVSMPPGLVGKLGGIPQCPLSDAAAGTCSDASKIGVIDAGVGAGPNPLHLNGSVYLADPLHSGDPASLSVVIPSKVGPFDFGNVVNQVRTTLRNDGGLDISLANDLPKIIGGVPIRVRSISSTVNHSDFIRNPTSCAQLQSVGTFDSREGGSKTDSSPFSVSGCDALGFSPKLRLILGGETKRFGHPSLQAIVTQPDRQANIARSDVLLPDELRPDTVVINKPGVLCQGAQANTRSCPPTSQVGTAKAYSPLLPQPLEGPVYIIQNPGNVLPKLATFLDGVVSIRLDAQNSIKGIRTFNQFEPVPDLPVSRFELNIKGGSNSIIKNFYDVCSAPNSSLVGDSTFTAHNGKTAVDKPKLETPACAAAKSVPKVRISLRKVASGKPVLKLKATASGDRIKQLRLSLPKQLRGVARRAKAGAKGRASAKLKRKAIKIGKRRVTVRKLPKRGAKTVTLILRRGAIKSRGSLASKVRRGKKPKLTFKVTVKDVKNKSFKVKRKVRAR